MNVNAAALVQLNGIWLHTPHTLKVRRPFGQTSRSRWCGLNRPGMGIMKGLSRRVLVVLCRLHICVKLFFKTLFPLHLPFFKRDFLKSHSTEPVPPQERYADLALSFENLHASCIRETQQELEALRDFFRARNVQGMAQSFGHVLTRFAEQRLLDASP